jgi:hypothetical protein
VDGGLQVLPAHLCSQARAAERRPRHLCSHPQEADSSKDAELIAGTTAHFVSQEQLKHRIDAIGRQVLAKQRRLAALQGAVQSSDGLKAQYDNHLQVLGRGPAGWGMRVVAQRTPPCGRGGNEIRRWRQKNMRSRGAWTGSLVMRPRCPSPDSPPPPPSLPLPRLPPAPTVAAGGARLAAQREVWAAAGAGGPVSQSKQSRTLMPASLVSLPLKPCAYPLFPPTCCAASRCGRARASLISWTSPPHASDPPRRTPSHPSSPHLPHPTRRTPIPTPPLPNPSPPRPRPSSTPPHPTPPLPHPIPCHRSSTRPPR